MQPLKLTMTAIRSSLTGHGRQADGLVDLVAGAEDLIHVKARVVLLKTRPNLSVKIGLALSEKLNTGEDGF